LSTSANAGNYQFVVKGDGLVGLGTNFPDARLHIKGAVPDIHLDRPGGADVAMSPGAATFNFGTLNSTDLDLMTGGATGMRLEFGGRIGMGTNNPGGTVHISTSNPLNPVSHAVFKVSTTKKSHVISVSYLQESGL